MGSGEGVTDRRGSRPDRCRWKAGGVDSSARVSNSPGSRLSGGCRSSGCASGMAGGEGDAHSVPVGRNNPRSVGATTQPDPSVHLIAVGAAARIDVPQRVPDPAAPAGDGGGHRAERSGAPPSRRPPARRPGAAVSVPAARRAVLPVCPSARPGAGKTPGWSGSARPEHPVGRSGQQPGGVCPAAVSRPASRRPHLDP